VALIHELQQAPYRRTLLRGRAAGGGLEPPLLALRGFEERLGVLAVALRPLGGEVTQRGD
jgi:hypothetical protein